MSQNKVINSFIWKFLERASTQIINLIIQVVLTRLIVPEDFGALALLIVFVNIANIFVQKGFSSSLIRKQEVTEEDSNTVFTVSMLISTILYSLLFLTAPSIAEIYSLPVLTGGLRIISVQFFFGSVYCVQNALLIREMRFKAIFVRGFISTIISGSVGITMAVRGYGLWALVIQSLLNQVLLCITAWFAVQWRPRFFFSKRSFYSVFSFGGKILLSELLSYGVESVRTLLIGGRYSEEMLSYYDRGQTYPATLMRGIYDTVSGVLLPHFSKEQDRGDALAKDVIVSISLAMFLVMPMFLGMAAVAPALIRLLLTEKWMKAVPYFILFSIYQVPYPIQGICRQAIYARGKSGYVLKMEIIKACLALVMLLIALPFGVMAIAVSALVTMYATTLINLMFAKKTVSFRFVDIGKKLWKTTFASVAMYVVVVSENMLGISPILMLFTQVFSGVAVYIMVSVVLKNENLQYLVNAIRKKEMGGK